MDERLRFVARLLDGAKMGTRTRPLKVRIPVISIHPQHGTTRRPLTPNTPITTAPSA